MPGMRLVALLHASMAQTNGLDGAGQHLRSHRRSEPFGSERMSDHGVVLSIRKKREYSLCHCLSLSIVCQRADGYGQVKNTDLLALPNDAKGQAIRCTAVNNHLIDQTAEECLLLIASQQAAIPDGG